MPPPPTQQVMGVANVEVSVLGGFGPEEAAALLAKETGLTIGGKSTNSSKSGSGNNVMMHTTGCEGSVSINDGSGKLFATLHFSSSNREMGMVNSHITLADGSALAQVNRPARQNTFAMSNGEFNVTLGGQPYATIGSGKSGSLTRADGSGGISYNIPCCQPMCKWICFSFCCFFCTVSVSACVGMYFAGKSEKITNVKSLDGRVMLPPLRMDQAGQAGSCDFGSLDARGKLDLFFLVCSQVADTNCQPPQSNNGGGGGGM